MKKKLIYLSLAGLLLLQTNCSMKEIDFTQYPSAVISNKEVRMEVYLPDPDKGLYRATRFDWSGVIGSVQYKGHEYFGYWKETHDPTFHEDLTGPVEGYIEPGPGYSEAETGGGFIRIGVGIIEKEDEPELSFSKPNKILDHGTWKIDQGDDWISFTHEIETDFGYGYAYTKTIKLKNDGFTIKHTLHNKGEKAIETDQFNHNFFMIDGERSGASFQITFPYTISTEDDLSGYLEISGNKLSFINDIIENSCVQLELEGFSEDPADHKVTVLNRKSGAGVTYTVDKPLTRMLFWACETTLCPENSIWISVEPGQQESWTSTYSLFVK